MADGRRPGWAAALQDRLRAQDPPLPEHQQIQSHLQHYVIKLKSSEERAFPLNFYVVFTMTEVALIIKPWPPLSSLKIAHFLSFFNFYLFKFLDWRLVVFVPRHPGLYTQMVCVFQSWEQGNPSCKCCSSSQTLLQFPRQYESLCLIFERLFLWKGWFTRTGQIQAHLYILFFISIYSRGIVVY